MLFVRRHILIVFFGITFLISWGAWLWVNATGQALTGWVGLAALLGAFGPAAAGMICAGLSNGWRGVGELLRRLVAWRAGWRVYLAVALGPLLLVLLPLAVNGVLSGQTPHWDRLLRLPGLLGVWESGQLQWLYVFAMLLVVVPIVWKWLREPRRSFDEAPGLSRTS